MTIGRLRTGPLALVVLLAAIAIAAFACADAEETRTPTASPTGTPTASPTESPTGSPTESPTATETPDGGNGNGGEVEIMVSMKDNFFEPKDITVPVNTKIIFKTKNDGTAIHNMHVLSAATEGQDFQSDLIVQAGQESTFEATFTQTGTIDFQCDYHVPDMVGTITVQ